MGIYIKDETRTAMKVIKNIHSKVDELHDQLDSAQKRANGPDINDSARLGEYKQKLLYLNQSFKKAFEPNNFYTWRSTNVVNPLRHPPKKNGDDDGYVLPTPHEEQTLKFTRPFAPEVEDWVDASKGDKTSSGYSPVHVGLEDYYVQQVNQYMDKLQTILLEYKDQPYIHEHRGSLLWRIMMGLLEQVEKYFKTPSVKKGEEQQASEKPTVRAQDRFFSTTTSKKQEHLQEHLQKSMGSMKKS